jgi:hypothetical protein
MPALVAGIHVFKNAQRKAWMAGTSPAMTIKRRVIEQSYNPNF